MATDASETTAHTFGGGFYTPDQMAPWPKGAWSVDFESRVEFRKTFEVEPIRAHKRRRPAKGYRRHVRRMKERNR